MTDGNMRRLRWVATGVGLAACFAPMAHLLEMPNKLRLDGALWLAIQQHLYAGWGPLIGAPTETAGTAINLVLLAAHGGRGAMARRHGLAALCYVAMLVCFFVLNAPVNAAVATWTAATLPPDWASYRLRWEIGHGLAALFALLALAAVGGRPTREG
jgi:hypothetical protein